MNIDRKELEHQLDAFRDTLSDMNDEFWASEQDLFAGFADKFVAWLYHEDIEKEKRRALYEQLKKEFEDDWSVK